MSKLNFSKETIWRNSPWVKEYKIYKDGSLHDLSAVTTFTMRAKSGVDSEDKTTEYFESGYISASSHTTSGHVLFHINGSQVASAGQFTVSVEWKSGADRYTFYKHMLTVEKEVRNVI